MGSGIRSQEKRLGGTATNSIKTKNKNSVYTHIIHKETQKKKEKQKIPKTDNATYKLFGIHTTFYFPLCCHVDTCF